MELVVGLCTGQVRAAVVATWAQLAGAPVRLMELLAVTSAVLLLPMWLVKVV